MIGETWTALFPCQVAYVFQCSVCDVREEKWFDVKSPGDQVFRPVPPLDWRIIGGVLVCHYHKVDREVMIDGVTRTLERDLSTGRMRWMTGDELLKMVTK